MYVLQHRETPWSKRWITEFQKFPTLNEARAAYERLSAKAEYRIAEEYTVTRYKPVK